MSAKRTVGTSFAEGTSTVASTSVSSRGAFMMAWTGRGGFDATLTLTKYNWHTERYIITINGRIRHGCVARTRGSCGSCRRGQSDERRTSAWPLAAGGKPLAANARKVAWRNADCAYDAHLSAESGGGEVLSARQRRVRRTRTGAHGAGGRDATAQRTAARQRTFAVRPALCCATYRRISAASCRRDAFAGIVR